MPSSARRDNAVKKTAIKQLAVPLSGDRQFVTALARGLDILRAFQPGENLLANRDIAERTNLPRPTVSRLTHTLTKLGYLVYEPEQEKYRLGSAVLSLGYAVIANMELHNIARPYLQEIADYTRAACALGDVHGLQMIYVESYRGKTAPFTLGLGVGSSIPIATTAMGRAYLAALPEDARAAIFTQLAEQYGRDWRQLRQRVDTALDDYARTGFVLSVADWVPEINSVGVPIVLEKSNTVMAINCGGAASLLSVDFLTQQVGPRLVAAKHEIEAASRR
jgi:DNA-binding IclR family transcriptional regulator